MPQIQKPEVGKALQRALGLEGASPTPTLSPELVATIPAEDATLPEFWDPNEKRLAGGYISQAAGGAGTYSLGALINPSDSGIIAILESCAAWSGASVTSVLYRIIPDTTYSVTGYGYYRDTRYQGQSRCGLYAAAPAVLPGQTIGVLPVTTNAIVRYEHPVVIGPGDALIAGVNVANTSLYIAFQWRERIASFHV